jgi:hypothetical protein
MKFGYDFGTLQRMVPMQVEQKGKAKNQPAGEADQKPAPVLAARRTAMLGTELDELPARQRTALLGLVAGKSFADAARTAGVTRQTLYDWRTRNPRFAAVFNAWQADAVASAQNGIVALLEDSVAAVGNAVRNGDTRTALEVMRRLGVLDAVKPGPTDPTLMERTIALDQRDRESKLDLRQQNLDDDAKMQKFFDLIERGGLGALGGKPGA